MSLYQCSKCNEFYTKSAVQENYDIDMAKKYQTSVSVIICSCGAKHVCGYEKMEDGYYSWGNSYNNYNGDKNNLLRFKAIMLKEVGENDFHTAKTIEGSIYDPKRKSRPLFLSIDTDKYILNNTVECYNTRDVMESFGLGQIRIGNIHKMVACSIKNSIQFRFAKRVIAIDNETWGTRNIKADHDKLFVFIMHNIFPSKVPEYRMEKLWKEVDGMKKINANTKNQNDIK
jgi:hypothetical protein